jgi:putative acetyltransferase
MATSLNFISSQTKHTAYVADDEGVIAGFGELEPNGHIDCFYCHKKYHSAEG